MVYQVARQSIAGLDRDVAPFPLQAWVVKELGRELKGPAAVTQARNESLVSPLPGIVEGCS
jgi:hypothetical protein